MKKLLMCLVVMIAALALTVPAMADADNSNNAFASTGIQSNGSVQDVNINSGTQQLGLVNVNDSFNNNNIGTNAGGGNITATGGNVVHSGNSAIIGSGNSSIKNSGNSHVNVHNSNNQGQEQGQEQEQGQAQGQSQSIQQTFEAAKIPRQFAYAPDINYPGTMNYFGPATNQPNYVTSETFLMFQQTFTREYVEAALSSHHGFAGVKERFHYYTGKKATKDRLDSDALTVVTAKPEGKVRVVGYYNVWATNVDRDSLDVFYNALEDMLNVDGPANTVWITGEGAMSVVKSFGWGIGLNYTQAFVQSDNKNAGSGTGGTGISGSEAGYRAKPFLQMQLLIVE